MFMSFCGNTTDLQDRGLAKEMKFIHDMVQRQQEEEKARIPKANPLPYTTDYPEVCICSMWASGRFKETGWLMGCFGRQVTKGFWGF